MGTPSWAVGQKYYEGQVRAVGLRRDDRKRPAMRRRRWTTAEKLRKGAHKVLATRWLRSGQKIYGAAKALFWPDSNNVFRCI
jgi:hypothetical protein